jgi:hypothetical protein
MTYREGGTPITKTVRVTSTVKVTVDASKFDADFMAEFRRSMYPFRTLDEHIEHLGQMYARGIVTDFDNFIEGYGEIKDMGISFSSSGTDMEIDDAALHSDGQE